MVTRPKKNRHIAQYYAKEETAALLEMAKDGPIYVPILLAAYYGLRRSEVLGLRWSAVDFEKRLPKSGRTENPLFMRRTS